MIFVVSGEGPSDIGSAKTGFDAHEPPGFNPGPMTLVIDRLLEPILDYSVLDTLIIVAADVRRLSHPFLWLLRRFVALIGSIPPNIDATI